MSTIPSGLTLAEPTVVMDAWVFTISVLEAFADQTGHMEIEPVATQARPLARKRRERLSGDDGPMHAQPHARVTIVERLSERSILVNWCDSTSCHYCDQLWIRRSARSAGYCALTGDPISRRDVVYGPYTRVAHPPANEQAMILASSLGPAGNPQRSVQRSDFSK